MGLHRSTLVCGSAGVDAGILELGVVYDQLGDVSNYYVSLHMVGLHYSVLFTFDLLFPCNRWLRFSRDLTEEAGRFAQEHKVVCWVADHDGTLNVHGCGLKMDGGGPGGGLRWKRTSVRQAKVVPAGDFGEGDAPGTGLGIQVALVVVGHAIRGACEIGFPSATVPALAHRLCVPDFTL